MPCWRANERLNWWTVGREPPLDCQHRSRPSGSPAGPPWLREGSALWVRRDGLHQLARCHWLGIGRRRVILQVGRQGGRVLDRRQVFQARSHSAVVLSGIGLAGEGRSSVTRSRAAGAFRGRLDIRFDGVELGCCRFVCGGRKAGLRSGRLVGVVEALRTC